ncbi:MAG: NADPH-dependent oxidoreductase [Bacteroidetes bacterium]|nr:NADPH-dependent oxidoreductase [Bacteroidota bacterium]
MKHTILSGSSRKNSTTLLVAKAIRRVLHESGETEIELVDFEDYDIPFFNQDIDVNHLSAFQQRLMHSMSAADSIILVTPEYNWFPSAEIVHLVHRMADTEYSSMWDNKVFSFVGVSTGRGGRMPTVQMGYVVDKIINVMNFDSVTNPKSFEVQFAKKVLDAEGNSLGNHEFDQGLRSFVDYHNKLSKRWLKNS